MRKIYANFIIGEKEKDTERLRQIFELPYSTAIIQIQTYQTSTVSIECCASLAVLFVNYSKKNFSNIQFSN